LASEEPEHFHFADWVKPGDWELNIGVNVCHPTFGLSEVIGPRGRVIALEPVPDTFGLLTANTARFRYKNVTLVNVAASDATRIVRMTLPKPRSGLNNNCAGSISSDADGEISALSIPVNSLDQPRTIALVELDVGMNCLRSRACDISSRRTNRR
jgi:FkbM family methyltransferase